MTYVITEGCVDIMDRQCMDQCPVDAIHAGTRMAYINPDECIDCGACLPVCPQAAIFLDNVVPADADDYIAVNVEFFEQDCDFDDEGPHPDHPHVAQLPPRVDA
ncbi:indolepyruvate ferredoxin oxidoreductase subunit alpha [Rhodococcus sp. NPDC059968]|uniref:indolepyruvate ferredoxin oxidoreductase subunit alpha n=1 Tax=Rhodococcus sp. NPDC059968 TaxID=3347017 RepID=UPI00366B7CAB